MRILAALALLAFAGLANASTLYVTEFSDVPPVTYQAAPVPGATQTVTYAGASAQSVAFAATTVLVRIQCDSICNIAFGSNPTATVTTIRLTAGQTEYFSVKPRPDGTTLKVAVITGT